MVGLHYHNKDKPAVNSKVEEFYSAVNVGQGIDEWLHSTDCSAVRVYAGSIMKLCVIISIWFW